MYFNLHKTLSYNALFNFIIAERGVGKTVNTLAFFIRDFLNNGNQFVNIRRTKTELDDVNRDNWFFADIIELNLFPEFHNLSAGTVPVIFVQLENVPIILIVPV